MCNKNIQQVFFNWLVFYASLTIDGWQTLALDSGDIVFLFGFTAHQDYFPHFDPSQLFNRWGKNGKSLKKTPDHPQAELGLSQTWPELGSNTQQWDDEWFTALKIKTWPLDNGGTGSGELKFKGLLWVSDIKPFSKLLEALSQRHQASGSPPISPSPSGRPHTTTVKFYNNYRSKLKITGIIWAPSSEFVSSSIPSWQILTAHAQPFRGAGDLAFPLKVPLDSLLASASSEGSGETARMWRLAWTFAARIGDKYQFAWCGPFNVNQYVELSGYLDYYMYLFLQVLVGPNKSLSLILEVQHWIVKDYRSMDIITCTCIEPRHEKSYFRSLRPVKTQTGLLSWWDQSGSWNFGYSKQRYYTIQSANNKGTE